MTTAAPAAAPPRKPRIARIILYIGMLGIAGTVGAVLYHDLQAFGQGDPEVRTKLWSLVSGTAAVLVLLALELRRSDGRPKP